MKKILVVLLILTVVGGVFAQWSVGGAGEVGFITNFLIDDGYGNDDIMIGSSAYNMYGYYGLFGAEVNVNYQRDNLRLGMMLHNADGIDFSVTYQDDVMAFQASQQLQDLFEVNREEGNWNPGRLWGYYKFLDGMIHLEAAANSRDTSFWTGPTTVAKIFNDYFLDGGPGRIDLDLGGGFADVDHHQYLLLNLNLMDGVDVGFMLPGVFFNNSQAPWEGFGRAPGNGSPNAGLYGYHAYIAGGGNNGQFYSGKVEDVLKTTRIGFQFNQAGIDAALQIVPDVDLNSTLGLYFGFGYRLSDMLGVEASTEIYLGYGDETEGESEGVIGAFGLGVNANIDIVSAYFRFGMDFASGPKGKKLMWVESVGDYKSRLAFGAGVSANVIPTHLAVSLDALFHYGDVKYHPWEKDDFHFAVIPQIWFNFLGTGAGVGYWWPNTTALIVRYHYESNYTVNALDVTFKWAF